MRGPFKKKCWSHWEWQKKKKRESLGREGQLLGVFSCRPILERVHVEVEGLATQPFHNIYFPMHHSPLASLSPICNIEHRVQRTS